MPQRTQDSRNKATEGMVDYDRNSEMQQQLVNSSDAWIRRLVERIGLVDPEFTLVDYGCGPGRSAIETVRPAIEVYRGLSPTAPMAICHADQPGNDWNGLCGLITGPDGYGQDDPEIRSLASIGSFYNAMAAPGSVSLGTCFTATHWLSRPVRLKTPGAVLFAHLDDAARADLFALAEADWTAFLRHRARELRPTGFLIVVGLGAVPDAAEPTGIAATSRALYRAVQRVAESMADDGLLDREVLDNFVFPNWFRSLDELRRPIEREPDLRDAFEIEELRVDQPAVDPHDAFADDLSDPARYAEHYVGYLRGFAGTTLRHQLFGPAAKDDRAADALADTFYRRLKQLYEDAPGEHAAETWMTTLVLRRR